MKENTPWILTYMLLIAAFAYMIGWVSGELVYRCKNEEEKVAELYDQLAHTGSGTQANERQFRQLRSVLNDVHKHIVAVSKAQKSPPAKPRKINGWISSIRLFYMVWIKRWDPIVISSPMMFLQALEWSE